MSDSLSATITGHSALKSTCQRVDVFLCHNSRDKALIRQVADGLKLEFDLPYFLDVHDIPTGEAFMPWIENALSTCGGCAIFLGANGWGETHFWEATRALDRYRVDPHFKIIPVALPGISEDDMNRLGSGTLFQEVNWADFRNGPVDMEAIQKLRAAMLGKPWSKEQGQARLTPYLVRRDALRWEESRRKDRSILYRGGQLIEANALLATQSDLMNGETVFAFLNESGVAQSRRQRLMTSIAVLGAGVIGFLAVRAEYESRLAQVRFVGAEARQASSPDTGVLLAAQATVLSNTPEAYGALIERLDAQPYLRQVVRIGDKEISTIAFNPLGSYLYVGTRDAKIEAIDLNTMRRTNGPAIESNAVAMDIDDQTGELWVGAENGIVYVTRSQPPYQNNEQVGSKGLPITSLQIDPTGRWVAAGNYDHKIMLIDRVRRTIIWTHTTTEQRITALSFSADGEQIAAGNNGGTIDIFESKNGNHVRTVSTASTGEPRARQFARNGDLRAADGDRTYWEFTNDKSNGIRTTMPMPGPSAVALGPRVERGPMKRLDLVVRGFGSGDLALPPPHNAVDQPTVVHAHARTVSTVALSHDGRLAASGASDGTVALWDFQQRSPLFAAESSPVGSIVDVAYDKTNQPVVVTSSEDYAGLSAPASTGWKVLTDLQELTTRRAGSQSVVAAEQKPDSEGFVPIPEKVICAWAFAPGLTHFAWATRGGGLLWSALPLSDAPRVLLSRGAPITMLGLSKSGHMLYALEGNTSLMSYDLTSPTPRTAHYSFRSAVRAFVPVANGEVMVALDDQTLRRINFADGPPKENLSIQLNVTVGKMAFDSESGLLVVAGAGSSAGIDVGIIDGTSYRRLHSRRMGGAATALALARSAGLIIAGDYEGRLHLWDMKSMVPMASLQVSPSALTAIAISQDGHELTVSSQDGEVLRMSLDRDRWLAKACSLAGRELTHPEWAAVVPGSKPKAVCHTLAP